MRCPTFAELPAPSLNKTGWPWEEESPPVLATLPASSSLPKVSVVMPSFNQAQFIEETIRSVLLQNYPNLQFIIIDGGSTDGSVEVIRQYAPWISYWKSERDRGQSHAINKGIKRCTGQVVHWINSDDLLLPSALSTVAESFVNVPERRLVTGQARLIDGQSRAIGHLNSSFSSWSDFVTRRCNIAQVATFFDRGLFDELGVIDERIEYCMDSDILLRFTREYAPLILPSYLAAFRSYGRNKFGHNRVAGFREADRVYLKHLSETRLEPSYHLWSSNHWLAISSFEDLKYRERLEAILEAVKMCPALLCSFRLYVAALRASRLALKEMAPRPHVSRG
jgi:glycosyltransferase involved in cell wall biosynthesis